MNCECVKCKRQYVYDKSKGHSVTECNSCLIKIRKLRVKIKIIEHLGGKCYNCGYNDCYGALDCHHIDPSKKEFSICAVTRSWIKIKPELEKCVLLCSNCHRKLHHNCNYNNCICKDEIIISEAPEYNLPNKSPISDSEHTGRSKDPMYNKKYGSRQDAINAQNEIYLESNKEYVEQIKNSNINFSKLGWATKVSKIIKINTTHVKKWMKRNMLDFYNERCYKRRSPKHLERDSSI